MRYSKKIIGYLVTLIVTYSAMGQFVNVQAYAIPPVSPFINNIFSVSGSGIRVMIQSTYPEQLSFQVKGRIERLSPSQFTIEPSPNDTGAMINLAPFQSMYLTTLQFKQAFSYFQNLQISGISPDSIREGPNLKLPEGQYRICFLISNFQTSQCAFFNICNIAAPQFIQPLSNLNINSDIPEIRSAPQVVFTWLAPQSSCGATASMINYDFEIRELLAGQAITDAINNPYVFRKTSLVSNTFLLDTYLYKDVLKEGKKYIVRVKANAMGATPLAIENNGYSRIEAFQYGGNVSTRRNIPDPQDYYISFKERRSGYWDDVYTRYKKQGTGDSLVPVKEFIAFALTQNGTAYNEDAVELFLALNPDLADVKTVRLSYTPKLPEFPILPVNDQRVFDKEHQSNLEPDNVEENRFLKYLDTLNNHKPGMQADVVKLINDLTSHLNNIKDQVHSVDRVSVNLVNSLLSELLYELRLNSNSLNKTQYNQLQGLVSALLDLTAESAGDISFFFPAPLKKRSSLCSYQSNTIDVLIKKISFVNAALQINEGDSTNKLSLAVMKQLLPFDVIVWRNSKEQPYRPVLDAPDLTATYRVFYTLSKLYNHKNPEINAKSTNHLASTVQLSLPSNAVFKFWTLNMQNHKLTNAEDVDLKSVLLRKTKTRSENKRLSIVLKVD